MTMPTSRLVAKFRPNTILFNFCHFGDFFGVIVVLVLV